MKKRKATGVLCIDLLFLMAVLGIYYLFYWLSAPTFVNASYIMKDKEPVAFQMPLSIGSSAPYFEVELDMILFPWHPKDFHVVPDDCVAELEINNQRIELSDKAICWEAGATVDWSSYLHPGLNHIKFGIEDRGGRAQLHIRPSMQKGFYLLPNLFLAAAIFLYGYFRLL